MGYKTHSPHPNLGGKWGAPYSPNVAYLAYWGRAVGSGGAGSQEAEAGSPLQETLAVAGVGQYCGPWAGRRGCPSSAKQGRQERVPAMA